MGSKVTCQLVVINISVIEKFLKNRNFEEFSHYSTDQKKVTVFVPCCTVGTKWKRLLHDCCMPFVPACHTGPRAVHVLYRA